MNGQELLKNSKHFLIAWWPLIAILAVAAGLRLAALGTSPPTLFRDEVEKGYNAFALLKDGAAVSVIEQGAYYTVETKRWPLFLNVYNSHTPMIYHYAAMPVVAVLGLNAWSTRLPAALAGVLTVLLTFLLAREMLGRRAGLYAAAALAVSPWHVMFSRWAQQGIFVPLLATLGMWALLRWLKVREGLYSNYEIHGGEKIVIDESPLETAPPTLTAPPMLNGMWLMLSAAAFAGAFYAYDAGRVFVPLMAALLAVLFWRPLLREWKWSLAVAGAFLLLCAPTLAFMLSPESRARFEAVSSGASAGTFALNWLAHFNPAYLFLNGDANPRHSYPGFGQMHIVEALLWLAAIPALFMLPRRFATLIVGWLALGAVPAALTTEGVPHALRSIATLPAPALISGLGAAWLHGRLEARLKKMEQGQNRVAALTAKGLVALALSALMAVFIYTVIDKYPKITAPHWGYAENVIFDSGDLKNLGERDLILVSPNLLYAPYFMMFHERIEPDWTPDYFPSSSFSLETARRKRSPMFPSRTWRPEDLPGDVTEFVWVGPPADGWPGEVISSIRWPQLDAEIGVGDHIYAMVWRVNRAKLQPLPY